ncbi:P-loop containing nucleoside triphosphate hydrolase protein [Zopfochytrium polystomum]|nr:P-loop containing nucleoside triphosphate hydrolase protein [Zopfochytrium polystomum]
MDKTRWVRRSARTTRTTRDPSPPDALRVNHARAVPQSRSLPAATSATSHQSDCDKCGRGVPRGRRSDIEAEDGPLLKCVTCSVVMHSTCVVKALPKEVKLMAEAAVQKIGVGVQVTGGEEAGIFQCPSCYKSGLPSCGLCGQYEESVQLAIKSGTTDTTTNNATENGQASVVTPPQEKSIKWLLPESVSPLFRCSRCSFSAHFKCLEEEYAASEARKADIRRDPRFASFGKSPCQSSAPALLVSEIAKVWTSFGLASESIASAFGTEKSYRQKWLCNSCLSCPFPIAGIISQRLVLSPENDNSESAPNEASKVPAARVQFLVKLANQSHRWCRWVEKAWLSRLKGWSQRIQSFERDAGKPPASPPAFLSAIDGTSVQVDKVLEIEEGKRRNDPKRLLIKWCNISYEFATWEATPPNWVESNFPTHESCPPLSFERDLLELCNMEIELHKSVTKALPFYHKKLEVAKSRLADDSAPRVFSELLAQPAYIVGGQLKEYQLEGVNWLLYNWSKSTPAILADEMGLGKTLQIVSFISALKHERNRSPFIIVVPTITIGHWEAEFRRWAPDLVIVSYGGTRADRDAIRKYEVFPATTQNAPSPPFHVIISNYEGMLGDSGYFKNIRFECIFCDEGHRLKNDGAKTFKALAKLKAAHRVILTGTPLQNNLRELFNLLHFLDNKKWKNPKDMEAEFETMDDEKVLKIHEMLKPHFLRRTKAQVLTAIPPKAEILLPVNLTSLQKELYKAVLVRNYKLLRSIGITTGAIETRAAPLHNLLVELRKLCNHPYLCPNVEPFGLPPAEAHKRSIEACGKLALLQPLLKKLKEKGHRVLIFSQFKILLDILESFLQYEGHEFLRIDGETPSAERYALLQKFNAPDSPYFVFLLTTRTGGTGITLTGADTIIIYDVDWNPHQDNQAMARVHRIGQTKPVVIYKLFTKNSVEERMVERSKKKLILDHLVVQKMDDDNLDSSEISAMVRTGAQKLFEDTQADSVNTLKYEDADIERITNREEIIADELRKLEEEKAAKEAAGKSSLSFSFAKVWTLDQQQQPETSAEPAAAPGPPRDSETREVADLGPPDASAENQLDESFWDSLLKNTAALEEDVIPLIDGDDNEGRRTRRKRKVIDYSERPAKRKKANGVEVVEGDPVGDDPDWGGVPSEDDDEDVPDPAGTEALDEELRELGISRKDGNSNSTGLSSTAGTATVPAVIRRRRRKGKMPDGADDDPTYLPPKPAVLALPAKLPLSAPLSFDNVDPVQSQVNCWLCQKGDCRLRMNCPYVADNSFLQYLAKQLSKLVSRPTTTPQIQFRLRVVQRLLQRNLASGIGGSVGSILRWHPRSELGKYEYLVRDHSPPQLLPKLEFLSTVHLNPAFLHRRPSTFRGLDNLDGRPRHLLHRKINRLIRWK